MYTPVCSYIHIYYKMRIMPAYVNMLIQYVNPGRIQKIDSLFYYAPGENYLTFARTNFRPLFLSDVLANMTDAQKILAKEKCGDNKECIFDFAVTGMWIRVLIAVSVFVRV